MKPTVDQIQELREAIGNTQPLSHICWSELEPLVYIKELDQNDYFSKAGELTQCLGFVFSGILRIYYLNDKGEEWNKHFLRKNDFVASSISPEKKSITHIQALTKTTILCIPYLELTKLSNKYQEISAFIQKLTLNYLEQKQNREISLLSEKALNKYLIFKNIYPNLENKIQHYHIASYLGITPTQLSRLRKQNEKLALHQQM